MLFVFSESFLIAILILPAGTSACPRGKFYCRNLGSKPQFIFSSHVNDQICGEYSKKHSFFSFTA